MELVGKVREDRRRKRRRRRRRRRKKRRRRRRAEEGFSAALFSRLESQCPRRGCYLHPLRIPWPAATSYC